MRKQKFYYVYILASISGTLYIGITSTLEERVFKHKEGLYDGFTKKYGVNRLVYYESFDDVRKAIDREKQLKGWRRAKKIALIERVNPQWKDLSAEWYRTISKKGLGFLRHVLTVILSGASPAQRDERSRRTPMTTTALRG